MAKKKKTTDQFKSEVLWTAGDDYVVLGDYESAHSRIRMKHVTCGTEWEVVANNFLRGNRCPVCAARGLKTTERFKMEVLARTRGEYEVLGDYTHSKTKILMRHVRCGHEWLIKPAVFLDNSRCPYCSLTTRKTTDQFKQEVNELVGMEYEVLGEYEGAKRKILFKHVRCGREWSVSPTSFLSGSRCVCARKNPILTPSQFEAKLQSLTDGTYVTLETYQSSRRKLKMKHLTCETEWEVIPHNFLNGTRCPHCSRRKKQE